MSKKAIRKSRTRETPSQRLTQLNLLKTTLETLQPLGSPTTAISSRTEVQVGQADSTSSPAADGAGKGKK